MLLKNTGSISCSSGPSAGVSLSPGWWWSQWWSWWALYLAVGLSAAAELTATVAAAVAVGAFTLFEFPMAMCLREQFILSHGRGKIDCFQLLTAQHFLLKPSSCHDVNGMELNSVRNSTSLFFLCTQDNFCRKFLKDKCLKDRGL